MTEIIKETVTTQGASLNRAVAVPTKIEATTYQTVEYLIYFFFGVVEILLAFRLVLKLTGASLGSAFVGFIYGVTRLFTLPFEGIFRRTVTAGMETTSVFEPSTLVAIFVYAVLAWGIVKLIRISSGDQQQSD